MKQLTLWSQTSESQTTIIISCRSQRKIRLRKRQEMSCKQMELFAQQSCEKPSKRLEDDTPNASLRIPRRYRPGQIVAVGKMNLPIGEDASQAKLLNEDIDRIFELRESGFSYSQIAEKMDIGKTTAWAIVNGLFRDQVPERYRRIHETKRTRRRYG